MPQANHKNLTRSMREAVIKRRIQREVPPSATILNTLRVAMERADFNYRATGLKDFEVQAAKDWVRDALDRAA